MLFLLTILLVFQLYSFQNFLYFIDFIITIAALELVISYAIIYHKKPDYWLLIPLLVPWVYILTTFYGIGYLLFSIEIISLIYFFITLYKNKYKKRTEWINLFIIGSYCFVTNLWTVTLLKAVGFFFYPEKERYLQIFKLLNLNTQEKWSATFFPLINHSTDNLLNSLLIELFQGTVFVKISIVIIWLFAWTGIYWLAQQSHTKKIFNFNRVSIYKSRYDIFILTLCVIYGIYHAYTFGKFNLVTLGIFCNDWLIISLTSSWLLVYSSFFINKPDKTIFLSYIIIASCLLQYGKIFDLLHIVFTNLSFYFYKMRIQSAFYAAFSTTFLALIIWIIPIALLIIKKEKRTLTSLLSLMGALVFTLCIWSSHHFFIAKLVNVSSDLREGYYSLIIKQTDIPKFSQVAGIQYTTNTEILNNALEDCAICHIFPNQPIKKVDDMLKHRGYFLHLVTHNIRLVDIMVAHDSSWILYNLERSSNVTFLSLALYCLIFFPLFIFWFSLTFILNWAHRTYFKNPIKSPS